MLRQYFIFFKLFLFTRYRWLCFLAFILTFVSSMTSSVGMGLYVPVIQRFFEGGTVKSIFVRLSDAILVFLGISPSFLSVLMLATVTIIAGFLLTYSTMLLAGYLCIFTVRSIKDRLITDILQRSYKYFLHAKVGNIVSVITEQAASASYTVENVFRLLTNMVLSLGFLVTLVLISKELTLILGFAGLMLILSQLWLYKKNRICHEKWNDIRLGQAAFFTETVVGIKTLKSMGLEKYRHSQANDLLSDESKIIFKTQAFHHLSPFYVRTVSILLSSIGIYVGIKVLSLTGAETMVFLVIISRLSASIGAVNTAWLDMIKSLPQIGQVMKHLDFEKPEKYGGEDFEFQNAIEIKNIDFSYGENTILNNFSLSIQKNIFLALVGPSGGGKSTIVDLILGLQKQSSGEILYDGKSISEFRHEGWCHNIGIVSQDIFLFNDTIANNIAFGDAKPNMSKVKRASKLAYAEEFIKNFTEGYDTILGDRGVKISGGQRQRIALARALYHSPKLLILDEATSALDSESEKYIQDALREIHGQLTIVAVAHRLSTIRDADCIVYIENGRIMEQGTHEELMKLGNYYKKMKQLQVS